MSGFTRPSQAGGYDPRPGTSNPMIGECKSQQPAGVTTASLHDGQVLYGQDPLSGASLYGTLTPLPSPPVSILGQTQCDIGTTGSIELARFQASNGSTNGTALQRGLPAGTWARDMAGDVFTSDAVGLTSATHQNAPQVFQNAQHAANLPRIHQDSFRDHGQFSGALQQGGNSGFYGWPTPPVESAHGMSWFAGHRNGQPQDYQLSARICAQLESAPSGASFGRCQGGAQPDYSFAGLYAPSCVPPASMGIHAVSERQQYYQHGLQMDEKIASGTVSAMTQEQLPHNTYQQQQRTTLHLASSTQHQPLSSDTRQPQLGGSGQPSPCAAPLASTPPRPKLTTTFWEEERTTCYQVDAQGVCVARRKDNNMVNGTKLLNVAGLSRGKRDALLKGEKERHVVRSGPMPLKGVWIPLKRAVALSTQFGIDGSMHPLFEDHPDKYLLFPEPRDYRVGQSLPLSVLSRPSPSAAGSASIAATGAEPPPTGPQEPLSSGPLLDRLGVREQYRDFIIPS